MRLCLLKTHFHLKGNMEDFNSDLLLRQELTIDSVDETSVPNRSLFDTKQTQHSKKSYLSSDSHNIIDHNILDSKNRIDIYSPAMVTLIIE